MAPRESRNCQASYRLTHFSDGISANLDDCPDRTRVEDFFGLLFGADPNASVTRWTTGIYAIVDPYLREREAQEIGHFNFINRGPLKLDFVGDQVHSRGRWFVVTSR